MAKFTHLLDTNILSELIKLPTGSVAQRIADLNNEDSLCTSIIVACELRYGARKKGSKQLTQKVEQLLANIAVLPLEASILPHYADIRTTLEKAGLPIGANDLLIAAHARSLGLAVVTANVKEFNRVADLAIENWLD